MEHPVILLIEDNPDDEALMLRALRKHQIASRVDVVRDGAEALDYLFGTGAYAARDLNKMPTLVLLDLQLPKVDGLEVLRRLRANERTRLLTVVVLTTSDEETDRVNSYRLCANSFVRKPVDFDEFAEAIRQIGNYWLTMNMPADVGK